MDMDSQMPARIEGPIQMGLLEVNKYYYIFLYNLQLSAAF